MGGNWKHRGDGALVRNEKWRATARLHGKLSRLDELLDDASTEDIWRKAEYLTKLAGYLQSGERGSEEAAAAVREGRGILLEADRNFPNTESDDFGRTHGERVRLVYAWEVAARLLQAHGSEGRQNLVVANAQLQRIATLLPSGVTRSRVGNALAHEEVHKALGADGPVAAAAVALARLLGPSPRTLFRRLDQLRQETEAAGLGPP